MVRQELSQLVRLASPIILTQLSQMGMGVADTVMAGRLSAADLAGVALGGNLFWPAMLFITGLIMSITPSVSQLHGRGQGEHAGEVVRQALWMALVGGSALIVLLRNAEPILRGIEVDPLAIPIAGAYLKALSWGILPMLGFFAMRYLCDAMSWTLPAMVVALSGLVLKVPLNALFIYGGFGLQGLGGAGCGYASAVVMTGQMLAMAGIVAFSRMRSAGLFTRFSWPDMSEIGRLFRLGAPIGASHFLEISMFSVVTLLIGRLGVDAVAAHQIAGNVAGLTFMVPLALGMAASVRVGFNVGRQDWSSARRSGNVALAVSIGFGIVAAVVIYFCRDLVPSFYTKDPAVFALGVNLMLFVVAIQVVDCAQGTAMGALRGYKDTRMPMLFAGLAYWGVGLPLAALLGFGLLGLPALGVYGFWSGTVMSVTLAAVAFIARFQWLSRRPHRIRYLAGR